MSDLDSSDSEIIEEFRRNGGKVGGYYEGTPLLLLSTIGRRSGKRRTTPLAYLNDGDRLILVAANVGATRNPDWYYNLMAHPQVTVEVGDETFDATATILEGDERERFLTGAPEAWAEAKKMYPELPDWPRRSVPVVALSLTHN